MIADVANIKLMNIFAQHVSIIIMNAKFFIFLIPILLCVQNAIQRSVNVYIVNARTIMSEEEATIKFLADFWDWMHHEWYLSSSSDICANSNDEAFRGYAFKYLKSRNDIVECEESVHMWTWMPKDKRACMRCGILEDYEKRTT